MKTFENEYKVYDDYAETFEPYNKQMLEYYDLRSTDRKSEDYLGILKKIYGRHEPLRANLLRVIEQQGFLFYTDI